VSRRDELLEAWEKAGEAADAARAEAHEKDSRTLRALLAGRVSLDTARFEHGSHQAIYRLAAKRCVDARDAYYAEIGEPVPQTEGASA